MYIGFYLFTGVRLAHIRDKGSPAQMIPIPHGGSHLARNSSHHLSRNSSQHLASKARKTYRAVGQCLQGGEPKLGHGLRAAVHSTDNSSTSTAATGRWRFPVDAEEHYQDILAKTKAYRRADSPVMCV